MLIYSSKSRIQLGWNGLEHTHTHTGHPSIHTFISVLSSFVRILLLSIPFAIVSCHTSNAISMPRFIALIWDFSWFHWNSPTILLHCLWGWQVWIGQWFFFPFVHIFWCLHVEYMIQRFVIFRLFQWIALWIRWRILSIADSWRKSLYRNN